MDNGNEPPPGSARAVATGLTDEDKRRLIMETFEKLMDIIFEQDSNEPGGAGTTDTTNVGGTGNTNSPTNAGGTIHIIDSGGGGSDVTNNGSIAGRVVDNAGAPVAGVSVAIGGSSPMHSDIAALTNGEGRFRLSGLAPGSYTVAANQGTAQGVAQVTVAPGQQAEVEIGLNG